jgi:serine/threonine-protein kinase
MPDEMFASTVFEDRFQQMLANLVEAEERGERLDVSEVIRCSPELETPLLEYFRNRSGFDRLAPQLAPTATHSGAVMPPELMPGSKLGGYEVCQEVGRGGRGVVYRVRDPELKRPLAVKVLRPELHDQADAVQRFLEEAQVTGQLQHPGVVPVHAIGQLPDGRPYFAMKLIEGRTLAALLAERPTSTQDVPRFLGIFDQVCQAVAYAHSRGVIHRDLKPANIMVGAFGEVQVMDWGLAKVLNTAGTRRQPSASDPAVFIPSQPDSVRTVRTEATALSSADGIVVGTIAYVSPEQAKGQVEQLDPQADVFGLGAVLCEILTGLPPYAGAAAWRLHLMAAAGDLADAYSRLGGCGADAELVALTKDCLAVERNCRLSDAGAVAARLAAYLAGVQERMRRAEQERAAAQARAEEAKATARAERRARRRTMALVSVATAAILAGGAAAAWYWQERASRQAKAEADASAALEEVRTWLDQEADQERRDPERWAATVSLADAAVKRAEAAVASAPVDDELQERVRGMRAEVDPKKRDSRLRVELDRLRLEKTTVKKGRFHSPAALGRYREALEGYGIDLRDVSGAVAIVHSSRLRLELLAALEDWARIPSDQPEENKRLRRVLEAAEPDHNSFRTRWREAQWRRDGASLATLANAASGLSTADVVNLAQDLRWLKEGDAAVRLLRQGQRRFPDDFWINHDLGMALSEQIPPQRAEAVRYLTVAAALRAQSPGAHLNLGNSLAEQGSLAEAESEYRKAIELDPKYAQSHNNLAVALEKQGKLAEAVGEYRLATQLDPKFAWHHYNLAKGLHAQGKATEAALEFRAAIQLAPNNSWAHNDLGLVFYEEGKFDDAVAEFTTAIQLDRKLAWPHNNLGNALYMQGKLAAAIEEYQKAIDLDRKQAKFHIGLGITLSAQGKSKEAATEFGEAIHLDPKDANAHTGLAKTLHIDGNIRNAVREYLKAIELNPNDVDAHSGLGCALLDLRKVSEAVAEFRTAIQLDPKNAVPHYNLGRALAKQGCWQIAVDEYRQAIKLDAMHAEAYCNLGLCLGWLGQFSESAEALKRGDELGRQNRGWNYPSAAWLFRAQQRVAFDQRLTAWLEGGPGPRNNYERLELAAVCRLKQLNLLAIQLSVEAFAAEPKLAGDLQNWSRYHAACCAVLAAAGIGKDSDKLDAKERKRLRRQALEWLAADLDGWAKRLAGAKMPEQKMILNTLERWQMDPDLAGVREEKALAKLTADERDAWKKLWADVEALRKRAALRQ